MPSVRNISSHSLFRPELNHYPDISLPVYPRSLGHFVRSEGLCETVAVNEKPFVQFFWGIKGYAEFEFTDKIYPFKREYVIYQLPNEPYRIRTHSESCEYRWIAFDGPGAADFMNSFGYPRGSFPAGPCPHQYFVNIENHMIERTSYSWRRMFCEICNILAEAGGTNEKPSFENQTLAEVFRICKDNFHDPDLNIKTLTSELGLNRTTLLRVFRKKMNISPSEYLGQLRLQKALTLLQNTRMTLPEIAEQSGFTDVNYFCRFIKRQTGLRPSQLR